MQPSTGILNTIIVLVLVVLLVQEPMVVGRDPT
jgi:hypothetical protein